MKHLKQYESYGTKIITDVREFFSNLKILQIYFEDYTEYNNFSDEIINKTGLYDTMAFFGFTNNSHSQYSPIVNTVTTHLHPLLEIAKNNDWKGIYDYCNNSTSYIGFERTWGFTYENHIGEEIAKALNFIPLPYYNLKFKNIDATNKYNREYIKITESQYNKTEQIIADSVLNKKYDIELRNYDKKMEINIIRKEKPNLTPIQEKEIEEAKDFGQKMYDELTMKMAGKKYNI